MYSRKSNHVVGAQNVLILSGEHSGMKRNSSLRAKWSTIVFDAVAPIDMHASLVESALLTDAVRMCGANMACKPLGPLPHRMCPERRIGSAGYLLCMKYPEVSLVPGTHYPTENT